MIPSRCVTLNWMGFLIVYESKMVRKTILKTLLIFQLFGNVLSLDNIDCPTNHFRLSGMKQCHSHLTCADFGNITFIKRLGSGAVKDVFLCIWKGLNVVLSVPVNNQTLTDFEHGVEVLKLLNPSKHIVQFIGYCEEIHALMTEYHPYGNAKEFFNQKQESISLLQSINFCHQYSLILTHLHYGPAGRRVFCDSNSLEKLLMQLLVTSDLSLLLNDVDALPEVVMDLGVKCGHQQLFGTFIAPEQLWPFSGKFCEHLMPGYDEKTDIWKSSKVCEYFLKQTKDGDVLRYKLFDLHKRCRTTESFLRPTSLELELTYRNVLNEFGNHVEL